MTTQITAMFDSQDMADLAVMRLRKNSISFSVIRAEASAPQNSAGFVDGAISKYATYDMRPMTYMGMTSGIAMPPTMIQSPKSDFDSPHPERKVLKVRVKSHQAGRARDIIRASNGHNIKEQNL